MVKAELKVFIASPGDLEAERDAVEKVCTSLNSGIGNTLNVTLIPYRFEDLPARAGRPQSQINPLVDECDILIGILHRRWGSRSGSGDHSGFSEEFERGIERYGATGKPTVSLHFKRVEDASELDPGPQLAQVIEFRKRIELNHIALYKRFDSIDEFKLNVTNLLTSEIVAHAPSAHTAIRSDAQGPRADGIESLPQPEGTAGASGAGISLVLQNFAKAIQGEKIDATLDPDRLHLFSIAMSQDAGMPSAHLANRLYQRRADLDLSEVELSALFAAFLADMGAARDESQRVIPFAAMAKSGWIVDRLQNSSKAILELGNVNISRGLLALMTALHVRPSFAWLNEGPRDLRKELFWNPLTQAGLSSELVKYWSAVGGWGDLGLADSLIESESVDVRLLGLAVKSLVDIRSEADPVASLDAELLLDCDVARRWGGNPLNSMSTNGLEELITQEAVQNAVRKAALVELGRRGEWPARVVSYLLDEDTFDAFRVPSVRAFGRRVLGQTADAGVVDLIIAEAKTREGKNSHIARSVFARNAHALEVLGLNEGERSLGSDLEAFFEIAIEDPSHVDLAWSVINGCSRSLEEEIGRLKAAGLSDEGVSFMRAASTYSAYAYLVRSQPRIDPALRVGIHKCISDEDMLAMRYVSLLDEIAEDEDISVIIDHQGAILRSDSDRLERLFAKASSTYLKGFLSGGDGGYAHAALRELIRRAEAPDFEELRRLMRHEDDHVRVLAARAALSGGREPGDLMKTYREEGSTYFYNVVCELDRAAASLPVSHGMPGAFMVENSQGL